MDMDETALFCDYVLRLCFAYGFVTSLPAQVEKGIIGIIILDKKHKYKWT